MKNSGYGLAGRFCIGYCLVIVLLSVCFCTPAAAQYGQYGMSGDINFIIGQKELDEDDWNPLDEQLEFGVDFDCKSPAWPVSLAFGLFSSYDDTNYFGYDIEGRTIEFYGGVRKIFMEDQQIRPYIGGGLNIVYAEIDTNGNSFDDSDLGFWFGAGLYITLQQSLNLGINLMYSEAEVDLAGYKGEAGGFHYGFLIGYHW